jgi:acetyl-CoA carboxylase biotin carboxyl carrier protein
MNMKQLRELLKLFSQHGLTRLEVAEGETRILLAREGWPAHAAVQPSADASPVLQPAAAGVPGPGKSADPGPDFNQIHEVKSPMVGVFYAAPEPGGKPFVKVGDRVKKGDVMCIVEAMKLNNEITADKDGEVVDVCVQDGSIVEYGQTLFKLF